MTKKTILVTGATGNVGGALVDQLAGREDVTVRALVRRPEAAKLPDGVEAVRGDLSDPASLRTALTGVDSVFLVWPLHPAEQAGPVVEVIAEHATRVVYLSSSAVDDATDPITSSHAALEAVIRASGLQWTFLRGGGFAANALGWAPQIREDRVVRWPYGAAVRTLMHEKDLAAVGVLALTTDDHVGRAYALTGPEPLSQREQVRAIGEAIGTPVRWEEQSRSEARADLLAQGWPDTLVDAVLDAWAGMVEHPETVSPAFRELTGRDPRTFAEWAIDHAETFR
ncbi:NAD(P)H-binding protein [Amycolatopsis samaneae]|uniref:NAD(P)H-binding protein n=1 Tax=Amycolatopsis samaneae TaxID=664691 RepID=A0ABW5GLL4_9PSEU